MPDITYSDMTLLMDQSHEVLCRIYGKKIDSLILDKYNQYEIKQPDEAGAYHVLLSDYFASIGYVSLGKIYRIVFSDERQFNLIKNDNEKFLNLLASEDYKDPRTECVHRLALSETDTEYELHHNNRSRQFRLTKKEKFFEDFYMYKSYRAFASLYSYYYVILENEKHDFHHRIVPDEHHQDFSSEANILFILETELFKITACLVLSRDINEQMKYPDMYEIKTMFKRFISTKPLFEKLQYRYLGAQKEADFIFKQFQIGNILAEYDKSKELLKNYSEVANSISANRNSKILTFIGTIFTFMAGCTILDNIPGVISSIKTSVKAHPVPSIVLGIIVLIFIAPPIVRLARKLIAHKKSKD